MKQLSLKQRQYLMQVALGQEEADIVITGGDVVNVYSGELLRNYSVAIRGEGIAYVGPDPRHTIGPQTKIIDATGKVLVPGFIDGHAHMIYYCTPDELLRYVIKGGTTTIITEVMEITFASGYHGLTEYLNALKGQPLKIFATVPPSITLSRQVRQRIPTLEQLYELLQREEIVGVGEGYWQEVIRGDQNFPALAVESLKLRKPVEGHAAGCQAEKLQAYLTLGISSCHESVTMEEVIEKLRLGVFAMIREGSVRKELETICSIKDKSIDLRRVSLVTDGIDPRELMEKGYIECAVQRAIDLGFDPITAIQMVTLNPAEHFHLDAILGGIAPGKYADIVIIPDLRTIKAECVISNGQIIARDGELLIKPHKVSLPLKGTENIRVSPADFTIQAEGKGPLKVRVIDQVTGLVTRETIINMFPQNGELRADPEYDLLKVSLINCEGEIFTGFVRGFGIKRGALATSTGWETAGIIVVGTDEQSMAGAVNRVSALGGGIALYADGQRLAELPLPIAGILPNLPIEEIAKKLNEIQDKAKKLGFRFDDAPLTLSILSTPAIPFLRISESGFVDLKTGQVLSLLVA